MQLSMLSTLENVHPWKKAMRKREREKKKKNLSLLRDQALVLSIVSIKPWKI